MSGITPEASARELTVLAWRRTTLHWVVVAVVAARLFSQSLGAAIVAVAFATIVVAAALSAVASRRQLPDARGTSAVRLGLVFVGAVGVGVVSIAWVWST